MAAACSRSARATGGGAPACGRWGRPGSGAEADASCLSRAQNERLAGLSIPAPGAADAGERGEAFDLIVVPRRRHRWRGPLSGWRAPPRAAGPGAGGLVLMATSADRPGTAAAAQRRLLRGGRGARAAVPARADVRAHAVCRLRRGRVQRGDGGAAHRGRAGGRRQRPADPLPRRGRARRWLPARLRPAADTRPGPAVPRRPPAGRRGRAGVARGCGLLRQQLAEAEGKAEGMLRVSRAQAEEIQELQARLQRGAESRATWIRR